MPARKPAVMIGGQLQDLPDGDTVTGASLAVPLLLSGQAFLNVSQAIQTFTIADKKISANIKVIPSLGFVDTMKTGIIALVSLTSATRSGSFDVAIIQLQIDGKSPPPNKVSRVITLNYIGV